MNVKLAQTCRRTWTHSLVTRTIRPFYWTNFPDWKYLIENRYWELKVWKWILWEIHHPKQPPIGHTVLQYAWYDLRQVHQRLTRKGSVPPSSPPPPSTLQTKWKKNPTRLFQIQNCVNPVAWVHETVPGRRIVFRGLAPVQVVFI